MTNEVIIPTSRHEPMPGKNKSMEEIDEIQRRNEAAIEIQRAYRGYSASSSLALIYQNHEWITQSDAK